MKKILLIILCICLLTGCSNKNNDSEKNEKITSEIKFISAKISNVINSLNNIQLENYEIVSDKVSINKEEDQSGGEQQSSKQDSNSENSNSGSEGGKEQEITVTEMQYNTVLTTDLDDINWDNIKSEIELINNSWAIIAIDLRENKIPEEDILNFSNILNETILAAKDEDKIMTLYNLNNLYTFIPKFLSNVLTEEHVDDIEQIKSYIYTSFYHASDESWEKCSESIDNAENIVFKILEDTEYTKNKEYKISKTNMLVKELKNCINRNDKNLYFMKYKNLIETLNTL